MTVETKITKGPKAPCKHLVQVSLFQEPAREEGREGRSGQYISFKMWLDDQELSFANRLQKLSAVVGGAEGDCTIKFDIMETICDTRTAA